ncbi:MAG: glutathione S-transferase N-terminal domain-containing protein [Candidatus Omnitrophica bacterium]|nr:glutathione S-transferase N-terminal domain-containing protein [Candidatus Omnitrophota bacterium]
MKLLYTKRSPYARKVKVIAIEKGISLEYIDEDLQKKSRVLLNANPLGKVPTLLLDNGQTVFDSPVICQYIDNLNDQKIMIPRFEPKRLEVLKWEAMADDLTTTAINLYMEKIRHPHHFHKDFISTGERNIRLAYSYIEENLGKLKEFNLASIAVASAIGYIHFRLPHLKVEGNLASWFEEISKTPSMFQTIPVA